MPAAPLFHRGRPVIFSLDYRKCENVEKSRSVFVTILEKVAHFLYNAFCKEA